MKKNLILSACLFFTICLNSQELNVEVTYQKALKKISDKTDSKPRILKDIKYTLNANQQKSIFKYDRKLNINNSVNRTFIGRGGGSGVYYKDLKSKQRLEQKETADGDLYLVKIIFNKYDWKLTKETKYIDKYLCYKATATYIEYNTFKKENKTFKIDAWYTLEIPLPFGPAGYDGLPGLVLEVKNGGYYFIVSNVKIENKKNNKIIPPKKGKNVTLKEFNEIINGKMESVFGKDFYEKFKKRKKKNN